jgi:hypothetical protein
MTNNEAQALWQGQSTEKITMTPQEIRNRIERLARKTRRQSYGGYAVCLLVVISCFWWLTLFDDRLQQIGSLLTIAGIAFMAWQFRSNLRGQSWAGGSAASLGMTSALDFHRRQLTRQRDFHRGRRFWLRMLLFVPGPVLFLIGFAEAHPEVARTIRIEAVVFALLLIAAVPLNLGLASRYQRQLDEIDRFERDK